MQENFGQVDFLSDEALAALGAPHNVTVLPTITDLHRFDHSVKHLAHHHVDAVGIFVTHREGLSVCGDF